ncbi:MbnP family copper-binding protein [Phenylobacterium sp.]|uniref:MbnP family copper-binding protein n=1 Tax=Phenylobacterium sp. TaxID=1871053 RepID=UPI003D2E5A10
MTSRLRSIAIIALTLGATAVAGGALAADQDVTLRFAAKSGAAPLACGRAYGGVGTTKAGLSLQDFRLYVSAVRLIDDKGREVPLKMADDGTWQGGGVALLDFEDASGNCNGNAATNTVVKGTVPAGRYRGLAFDLGVPTALNHQDPTMAAPPLNVSALSWPWRAGYKHTTIDIDTSSAGKPDAAGFSIHIGATDCGEGPMRAPPSSPCRTQNRPTYRFERFDAARQTIVFDLSALLADTDITVNMPKTPAGCMSGPGDNDCVGVMRRIGLPFRDQPAKPQAWVRVE